MNNLESSQPKKLENNINITSPERQAISKLSEEIAEQKEIIATLREKATQAEASIGLLNEISNAEEKLIKLSKEKISLQDEMFAIASDTNERDDSDLSRITGNNVRRSDRRSGGTNLFNALN